MKIPNFLFLTFLSFFSSTVFSADQMFDFNINCNIDQAFCDKVRSAFNSVGQIISDDLILTKRIGVEVSFKTLDEGLIALTSQNQPILRSTDGRERGFPSALVRQKIDNPNLENTPDIDIEMNTGEVEQFWFPGDPDIQEGQLDFRIIALHEMIHGLGFDTLWELQSTDEGDFLTPSLSTDDNEDGSLIFESFVETIFDSFMVNEAEQILMTDITDLLIDIAVPGTRYNNIDELFAKIKEGQSTTGDGRIFTDLMLEWSTTEGILSFLDPNNVITLETSVSEFDPASSLTHVSQSKFANTEDFLMIMEPPVGITLEQKILDTGNHPGGGIGPRLFSILQKIGYTINNNLIPPGSQVNSEAVTFDTNFTGPLRFNKGRRLVDRKLKKPTVI